MFSLIILILRTLCDVLYESMLNSTVKLRINQILCYLMLSDVEHLQPVNSDQQPGGGVA